MLPTNLQTALARHKCTVTHSKAATCCNLCLLLLCFVHLLFGFFWLLLYLFYYHFLCVRAQSTHHLPLPLWVVAAVAAGRWCCCCCFSYKNQLYFLVTVSAGRCGASRLAAHPVHTPKATWLLDLIAIRAKYTLTHTIHAYAYTHTHTSADVTRTFLFILFWVTFHIPHLISPFPLFPFPFYSIIIYSGSKKCWLYSPKRTKKRNEPNEIETTPTTTKAKLNLPKMLARLCLLLLYLYFFYFSLFLCKVNELFVARHRRRSLIVFTVVASVAKCV